jgi:PAS domain S-box-containing protein
VKAKSRDNEFAELRRQAEEKIRSTTRELRKAVPQDLQAVIHELETHQVELEIQNEELRRTRQDLEESREQYADLYDFAPSGYFLLDRNGVITSCNLTGARLLGYDKHNLINLPFSTFVVKDDWSRFFAHLRETFDRQVQQIQELRVYREDRSLLHVQLQSIIATEREPQSLSCRTAVIDITERKRFEEALAGANEDLRVQAEQLQTVNRMLRSKQQELEEANENLRVQKEELGEQAEALRETEQRFRTLAEATFEGTYISEQGRIRDCNHQFARMLSYGREELLGRALDEIVAPEWRERVWTDSVQGGESVVEYEVLRRDGARRTVEAHGRTTRDGGRTIRITAVRDITERKRMEQTLREWNATLEARVAQRTAELKQRARQLQKLTLELSQAEDRERRRIAAALHEDLQQQLAAAKFRLSRLAGRVKQDSVLLPLVTELDRMLAGAIETSRNLSHDLSPTVLHPNDLGEVLHWLVRQMQARHGLTVHLDIRGATILPAEAVATFLFRAAQEMLLNVVKHAQVDDATVRVRRVGHRVYLSVSDRGSGFDPQTLHETPGFGLLSIRERVELLGGRVKIRSRPGRGSTILIALPANGVSDAAPPA